MDESTVWWLLAATAVAIELATGTFYLLMLSIGMAAGAVGAHLGLPVTAQVIAAAVCGGGAVVIWNVRNERRPKSATASANRDVHIDIGESVYVNTWNADGTANVSYRGANWTAILAAAKPAPAGPGQFRIKELLGNRLVLEKL